MCSMTSSVKNPVMIKPVGQIIWPDTCTDSRNGETNRKEDSFCTIFCVGKGYLDYKTSLNRKDNRESSQDDDGNDRYGKGERGIRNNKNESSSSSSSSGKKEINLLDLSPAELDNLSYYEILGGLPLHATADDVRKAFHRASLKYHPDKLSEEENQKSGGKSTMKDKKKDPIFLKVKEAFETLGNAARRKAYDSALDFDESIPPKDVSEADFFRVYAPVFERNLRFAKELDPSNKNKNQKKKNKKKQAESVSWLLGNDDTPINEVHAFYDYWTNFESWRDFTLEATKETKHDTDMAECRYEKRWMEKEIARLSKQLKKDEMNRIHTFVERAMASDPRLKREKARIAREKKALSVKRAMEKEQEQRRKQELEEKEKQRQLKQEEEEKQKREIERQKAHVQKKNLRKLKQTLRKVTNAAYSPENCSNTTWKNLEEMNKDVELLCTSLSMEEMTSLLKSMNVMKLTQSNDDSLLQSSAKNMKIDSVCIKASQVRKGNQRAKKEERDALRAKEQKRQKATQIKNQKQPWSKEELSVLAKAIKKYPAGNANRWETIANLFHQLCRTGNVTTHSRTKEDCIEKYNQMTSNNAMKSAEKTASAVSNNKAKKDSDEWSEEQDKQLQAGLAKFKASMDKNERWTSIAKCVDGKTKKECVQRFKAIREALKKK